MDDISELESRITAALDRIGQALEDLPDGAAEAPDTSEADAEIGTLNAALEDERTANAQLEERVKAIREKQDGTVKSLKQEVDRLRTMLAAEESGLSRIKQANAELRANNDALRNAVSEGVSEPHLINTSLKAELEALRTAQATDRAELDAVLGELTPMLQAAETAKEEGADA